MEARLLAAKNQAIREALEGAKARITAAAASEGAAETALEVERLETISLKLFCTNRSCFSRLQNVAVILQPSQRLLSVPS